MKTPHPLVPITPEFCRAIDRLARRLVMENVCDGASATAGKDLAAIREFSEAYRTAIAEAPGAPKEGL